MLPPVISSFFRRSAKPGGDSKSSKISSSDGKNNKSSTATAFNDDYDGEKEEIRHLLLDERESKKKNTHHQLENNQHHFCQNTNISPAKNGPLVYESCSCCRGQYSKYTPPGKMKEDFIAKYANIRCLGILLFILASVFCISKIIDLSGDDGGSSHSSSKKFVFKTQLKVINVFNRHGDRSPSDRPPPGDSIGKKVNAYWPNGISNLTDMGKLRQFRIGLELRHRYENFLDFDPKSYLAFSSPIYRCQQSLEETLSGLFNNEGTLESGHKLLAEYEHLNCTTTTTTQRNDTSLNKLLMDLVDNNNKTATCKLNSLPSGSGSPIDWRQVPIDTSAIPVLTYEYLNDCKYRLDNPTLLDKDLFRSKLVRSMDGTRELAELIEKRYNTSFGFDTLSLWSTVASEVRLIKTKESFDFIYPQINWVNKRMPEYFGNNSRINMFDLLEQVAVIGYRERLEIKETPRIQLGPMINTMVQSQLIALNRVQTNVGHNASDYERNFFHKNNEQFRDKKMVFYSTHDSILQFLMHRLNIIQFDDKLTFKKRFEQHERSSDIEKYLAGLKMAEFGLSLVFELWEMEMQQPPKGAPKLSKSKQPASDDSSKQQDQLVTIKRFPYVQAALYNRADGKYRPIDYKRLELGSVCQRLFKRLYPNSSFDRFYDSSFKSKLDFKTICPFDLFLEVTSEYFFTRAKLNEWCTK